MKLSEKQFMELSTTETIITVNSMMKFVSHFYEGRIRIQLHAGGIDLPKKVYFFNGRSYNEFDNWFITSVKSYENYIYDRIDRIHEIGV